MEKKIVDCIVTGIESYGIFVSCGDQNGLIHISEISDEYVGDICGYAKVGMKIKAQILEVAKTSDNLKLSYKSLHDVDPRIKKRYRIRKGFITLEQMLPIWIEKEEV